MPTLRSDLRTVPGAIVRTPLLWLPFALLALSFLFAVLLTQGTTNPDGSFTSVFANGTERMVSLYVQLTLPPTALFVFILAGALAGRTGYLVGGIVGLFDGILWSLLFLLAPGAQADAPGRLVRPSDVLAIIIVAVVVGVIVGGVSGGIVHLIRRSGGSQPVIYGQIRQDAALVRTYAGQSEAEVQTQYGADAAQLAPLGYLSVAEAWAVPTSPGGQGSLTVSYGFTPPSPVLRATPEALAQSVAAASSTSHAGGTDKTCPRCAETVKAAAVVCRFCGHEFADGEVPSQR